MTEIEYFKGDELAASVWRSKYALSSERTPDDMHRRMAKEFTRIEERYYDKGEQWKDKTHLSDYGSVRAHLQEDDIYNLFKDFKWIVPQGSIMSMLGSDQIGSLSNCFVIGQPDDSYGGIMQKDEQLVQLMKRRGGVGIDISTLRPSGTEVTNAAKTSTGAASFMERFSNSTREVAQGGRRGALMITIDCRHPDVLQFINAKKDRTKVTGANISVMLRDDFMEAVKKDEDYTLRFPCDCLPTMDISKLSKSDSIEEYLSKIPYNELCIAPNGVYYKKVRAKEIYDAIVENAWENAEPGQMFVDRHHDYSPDSVYAQYRGVTTNPCGEIFMQPFDSCRLFALNLYSFVNDPFTDKASFDYNRLYQIAYEQQRLADDLIDLELEHISRILAKVHSDDLPEDVKRVEIDLWEKVFDVAQNGRRTGCGFTGLADALAALNVKYDEGHDVIDKMMYHKMEGELDCTIDLAVLRGTFSGWSKESEYKGENHQAQNDYYQHLIDNFPDQFDRMIAHGRRNISFSTCAPTGSVNACGILQ